MVKWQRLKPGLLLSLVFAFAMANFSFAETNSAIYPKEVTKVLTHYALTSANDFSQRDPEDWRLLASDDDGRTWVELDSRKGEVFSQRHERRVFNFNNNRAFEMYRFVIDRVHDPAAAEGVQLAEIEPLDDDEDGTGAVPLFCDAITAQGENPPIETADKVFDFRAETKWFDSAKANPKTRASWIQWQYLDHSEIVITNIHQALSLRTRAKENFPVRLEATVVGRTGEGNGLWMLDDTGSIEIDPQKTSLNVSPGQRLLLSGTSQWRKRRVQILLSNVEIVGAKVSSRPRTIQPDQTMSVEDELRWVEVEGRITFSSWTSNNLKFELTADGRSLGVFALSVDSTNTIPATGSRVRVRGICESALNENGNRVAAKLWTPSMDSVVVIESTNIANTAATEDDKLDLRASDDRLLTAIGEIRQLTPLDLQRTPRVRIRGVVTEIFGECVQDATGGIEVWRLDEKVLREAQSLGAYVEIEGRAVQAIGHGPTGYGPVVWADDIHFLGNGKLPPPARPTRSMLMSGKMDSQWIEVEAVVRSTDGSHLLLASESGRLFATVRSAPASEVNQLVDANIRMRGVCFVATDERRQMQGVQILVPSMDYIEILQPGPSETSLPPKSIDSLYQLRGTGETLHRVKIEAVITCVTKNACYAQDSSGSVTIIPQKDVTLNLPSWGWWAFSQNDKSNTNASPLTELQVGDRVEVFGFPEIGGYAPRLVEASVRKLGRDSPVASAKTTASFLASGKMDSTLVTVEGLLLRGEPLGPQFVLQLQSGQMVFQAYLPMNGQKLPDIPSGSRISVTGVCQVDSTTQAELGKSQVAFSLLMRTPEDIALIDQPAWLNTKRMLIISGVLVAILLASLFWIRTLHDRVDARTHELKQEMAEHKKTAELLAAKTRLLQSEIEEHERTEAALAEKTGLLEAEIKERQLIHVELVEKKASLEREIEERKRIEAEAEKVHKQLLSASRMAGMADVATNVLHNVGNVLNSVNVLASSIAAQVANSKIPGVARLSTLLKQHQSDLGRFIADDDNGKHVPGHLERLGNHLAEEQSKLLEKTRSLTENVQHIKKVIAVQQNFARATDMVEVVSLPDVVEDALRMCAAGLERRKVMVVRNYGDVPLVKLDRHKMLQIIFNLMDNATNACDESNNTEKRITISIGRSGDETLRLDVSDNGIGISPENAPRIFSQGFSTRKDGHGFGLHSSILAAQDMGCSLSFKSGGPGCGATFTLMIPIAAKPSQIPFEETVEA